MSRGSLTESSCSSDPLQTHSALETEHRAGGEPQEQTPDSSFFFSMVAFLPLRVFLQPPSWLMAASHPSSVYFPREFKSPHKAAVLHLLPIYSFNYKALDFDQGTQKHSNRPGSSPVTSPCIETKEPSPRKTEKLYSRKHQSCKAAESSDF